jgi:hypothetical protein
MILAVVVFGVAAVGALVAYIEAPSYDRPSGLWYPLALAGLGLMILTFLGARAAGSRIKNLTEFLPPGEQIGRQTWFIRTGVMIFGAGLAFTIAYPLGTAIGRHQSEELFTGLLFGMASTSKNAGWALVDLAPIIVASLLAIELRLASQSWDPLTPFPPIQLGLAFLIALAARVPSFYLLSTIKLPAWLLVFAAVRVVSRRTRPFVIPRFANCPREVFLTIAVRAESRISSLEELDQKVGQPRTRFGLFRRARAQLRSRYPLDLGAEYLRCGPAQGWWQNGQTAALLGLVLATFPIAYYGWAALQSLRSNLSWSLGLLYFLIGLAFETFRWLGVSFAFGALYRVLPGRVGPLKAMVLAIAWLVAAIANELIARWLGRPSDQLWLYVFLQLAVFLFILSVLFDWWSVRRGGGTWRRLLDLYRVRNNRDLVAYAAPLAGAIIGLIQQLGAGSGIDLVKAFFESLIRL